MCFLPIANKYEFQVKLWPHLNIWCLCFLAADAYITTSDLFGIKTGRISWRGLHQACKLKFSFTSDSLPIFWSRLDITENWSTVQDNFRQKNNVFTLNGTFMGIKPFAPLSMYMRVYKHHGSKLDMLLWLLVARNVTAGNGWLLNYSIARLLCAWSDMV